MANVVPLVEVPLSSFFKTMDHNSSVLYKLREKSSKIDGFFLNRAKMDYSKDTFVLTGGHLTGSWYLGRIRATPSLPTDYRVEIYRRSATGCTDSYIFAREALDDAALVDIIRELDLCPSFNAYPSPWTITRSNLFADLGLDIS